MSLLHKDFKKIIGYQIYPSSFYDANNDGIGDLKGITSKLSYIKDLGVNAIWISPIYVTDFFDGGYDVIDHKKIDKRFGNFKDFDNLIQTAHKLGIKVFLDLVAGHLSENSKEFQMSAQDNKNDFSDLFIWNDDVFASSKDVTLISGKYPRNGGFAINYFATQPALNYGFNIVNEPSWQMSYNDKRILKTREFLIDIMRFWLNKGVDGFKVDMARSLVKNDPDRKATIKTWNYLFNVIRKEYPSVYFVSEWSIIYESGPAGFDCDFAVDSVNCFRMLTDSENMKSSIDDKKIKFYIDELNLRFDSEKKYNVLIGQISGNHDRTRISSLLDEKRLRSYLLIMYSIPCNPWLFAGDEIGMKQNPNLNKYGGYNRTGCRTPYQWNNGKNKGFSKANESKLILPVNKDNVSLENCLNDDSSIYYYIKKLIEIRTNNPDLYEKDCVVSCKDKIIHFDRGSFEILFNVSNKDLKINNILFTSGNNENILKPLEACIIKK